ncbi:hypothetical protein GPECTOR_201g366 [Gonium pectorale]|uniref:SET domain-containing protein n=1 Tax=Gonium pectorale TaxID=33097 RepID=A0A150FWY7_GONPE|nr:hypothetical protein GPECTOR_201g366 [Gonium pectorale]|eukprot:KXZ42116.1 hypothetical protein GPECTOR_201g366 [Gonium pectorale]
MYRSLVHTGGAGHAACPMSRGQQRRHQDCSLSCAAKSAKSKSGGAQGFKGFGEVPKAPAQPKAPLTFERDSEDDEPLPDEGELDDEDGEPIALKPAYQMYTDAGYKAQRFVGPITLQRTPDSPLPVLVSSGPALPGDLLLVSPALAFVPGGFQEVPELEDLHAELLEAGPAPPQRRVLSVLESLRPPPAAEAPAPAAAPLPNLATLDPKFWAGRGRDTSAPTIPSRRLMSLLTRTAAASDSQDPAAMQARHEKPLGYVGLWPEGALLGHSCVPNTSQVVVADRLLVHLTEEVFAAGTPLTRNMIGASVTAPLSVRQAAVAEVMGDLGAPLPAAAGAAAVDGAADADAAPSGEALLTACRCPRCQLESNVSESLRDTLESVYAWFTNEASDAWTRANEAEDVSILRGLLAEAEALVAEVEEGVRDEPGLDDEQQDWLRASVYDVYDLLVTLDELVNQQGADPDYLRTCLELIRVFAPGSDNHLMVALKHESLRNHRFQVFTELLGRERGGAKSLSKADRRKLDALRDAADVAAEFRVEAAILRYGYVTEAMLGALTEGLEAYVEGLEQLSMMRAQGMEELSREMEVEGVRVSIVDKLEVSEGARVEGAGRKVLSADGIQMMVMQEEEEEAAPARGALPAARGSALARGAAGVAAGEAGAAGAGLDEGLLEELSGEWGVGEVEGAAGAGLDEGLLEELSGEWGVGEVEGEGEELVLDVDGEVEVDAAIRAALDEALAADLAELEAEEAGQGAGAAK